MVSLLYLFANQTPPLVVHIARGFIPGGDVLGYNTGRTAGHEIGHWLGLFHTFQGGCSDPADHVDDTPAEAYAAIDCYPRDSCPAAGLDPVYNHMDLSIDECRREFTSGQTTRMRELAQQYRGL
ncbi:pregnancy-associated plasma protein-A-domain-containing protein [Aspergillus germanicus]